jgi:hypothetical protein
MQILKTIIVFIILHRLNKIDEKGIELMQRWYGLKNRNWITKQVFDYVIYLNIETNPKAGSAKQKYLIMVKLAETFIKCTEQLFFIPPVMLSLRQLWISKFLQMSGAMKHNGGAMRSVLLAETIN